MRHVWLLTASLLCATIYSSAQRMVSPKPATVSDRFPKKSGSLRVSAFSLSLGTLTKNAIRVDTIWLLNEGAKTMRLTLAGTEKGEPLPEYLRVRFTDTILSKREEACLIIEYRPDENPEFGFVLDRFRVVTDDVDQRVKMFYVNAYLKAYFPPMTAADSAALPKARFSLLTLDVGTVKSGKSVSRKIQCTNDGVTELRIWQAKPLGSGVAVRCDTTVIQRGKSANIDITFDTFGKPSGDFSRKVMFFLNDPLLPEVPVLLTGKIE